MNKYILNRPKEMLYLTTGESPRPTRFSYRRHGNKLYVMFSKQPPYRMASSASFTIGTRMYHAQAFPVQDIAEAQRVRYLFDRSASAFSDCATADCQIVRFEIDAERPSPPAMIVHRFWVLPTLMLVGAVVNAALEWALKR